MLGIFLDLETTGLDPKKHSVIDLAFVLVDLSSNTFLTTFQNTIRLPESSWERKDPASMRVNGYTWEEVFQGRDLLEVKNTVVELLTSFKVERGKAVFICQNPSFDRSFFGQIVDVYTQELLRWPYHWLDLASMYWTVFCQSVKEGNREIPEKMSLSKNEIACVYQLPPEAEPHRAINGVHHLIACYQAVLKVKFKEKTASAPFTSPRSVHDQR